MGGWRGLRDGRREGRQKLPKLVKHMGSPSAHNELEPPGLSVVNHAWLNVFLTVFLKIEVKFT